MPNLRLGWDQITFSVKIHGVKNLHQLKINSKFEIYFNTFKIELTKKIAIILPYIQQ